MSRVVKLNIIEPWEFGTEKAIEASIVKRNGNEYLIHVFKPLIIKNVKINYLIGEMSKKEILDLLSLDAQGTFTLNMIYSDEINEQNFKNKSIKEFRGNFLLGEITM